MACLRLKVKSIDHNSNSTHFGGLFVLPPASIPLVVFVVISE